MLPWLVGAAVVAGVGYLASGSDSSDDDDDYEREERRQRRQRREKEREPERNKQNIQSEINNFKNISKRQIKDKYGIIISFNDTASFNNFFDIAHAMNTIHTPYTDNINIENDANSKITHLKNSIKEIESENSEILTLISDLKKARDAV